MAELADFELIVQASSRSWAASRLHFCALDLNGHQAGALDVFVELALQRACDVVLLSMLETRDAPANEGRQCKDGLDEG
jgi:hypothetical protein